MQINETNAETFTRNQSQDEVAACHEEKNRTLEKQKIINESGSSTSWVSLRTTTDSAGTRQITPSGSRGSPELTRTMSKTEAVRQDVRRLKSVTLGRMGKMFKTRMPIVGRSSLDLDTNVTSVDNYDEETSRKEKTNSLGRILKLVDKDGSSKKLFVRPRAGSLSRILRRHPHNEDNGVIDKSAEDTARGILSRMLSQLRGK